MEMVKRTMATVVTTQPDQVGAQSGRVTVTAPIHSPMPAAELKSHPTGPYSLQMLALSRRLSARRMVERIGERGAQLE